MTILELREQSASDHSIIWEQAYRWPKTYHINTNQTTVFKSNQLFKASLPPGQTNQFTFVRKDGNNQQLVDRVMFADVKENQEYLVICDPGDQWTFRCLRLKDSVEGSPAKISFMTTASDQNIDTPEEILNYQFPMAIPYSNTIHVLIKAGKRYTFFLLSEDHNLHHFSNWRIPDYFTDTLVLPSNARREITQHKSIPLTIHVLPPPENQNLSVYPFSDVYLVPLNSI